MKISDRGRKVLWAIFDAGGTLTQRQEFEVNGGRFFNGSTTFRLLELGLVTCPTTTGYGLDNAFWIITPAGIEAIKA